MEKKVCYTYMKKTNKDYLEKLSNKTGQSISHCLDAIIDSVRLKKELKIEKHIPKFVQKAREYEKRGSYRA